MESMEMGKVPQEIVVKVEGLAEAIDARSEIAATQATLEAHVQEDRRDFHSFRDSLGANVTRQEAWNLRTENTLAASTLRQESWNLRMENALKDVQMTMWKAVGAGTVLLIIAQFYFKH